jgi:3-hydroxyacyl-[acyl-carrier-protein] dehydratase
MTEIEETTAVAPPVKQTMDIIEIMSILPHRYPFLMIDRIVEIEPRKRIVAIKNVTATEPHFLGHFPGYPIMPGVLIVEAMAQSGGALLLPEFPNRDELLMLFTGIDNAKFRRPVVPGDQVRIEVTILNWRRLAVKLRGIATVDDKVVCEATLMCMLVDNPVHVAKKAQIDANEEAKPEQPATAPVPEAVLS